MKNSPHDVQTKGGGVKGLLNNVQKNCTFLSCRLPLPEERGPEDAKGEEEAEREAEEERGEDRERDQHRVPGHTQIFTSSRYRIVSAQKRTWSK